MARFTKCDICGTIESVQINGIVVYNQYYNTNPGGNKFEYDMCDRCMKLFDNDLRGMKERLTKLLSERAKCIF